MKPGSVLAVAGFRLLTRLPWFLGSSLLHTPQLSRSLQA